MFKLLLISITILVLSGCQNEITPPANFWELHKVPNLSNEDYVEFMVNFFLEDLHYLEEHLLSNSPLINVAARRTGVETSFRFELASNDTYDDGSFMWAPLRREPSDTYVRLAAELFSQNILQNLFPSGFGHMRPISPELAINTIMILHLCDNDLTFVSFPHLTDNCSADHHHHIFRNPNVISFYNPDLSNAENHEILFLNEGLSSIPNIETRIIIPDSVAYVSSRHFLSSPEVLALELAQLLEFYEEISDFNHLIIDFRNHLGGMSLFAEDLFFSPLISEPLEVSIHQFFRKPFINLLRENPNDIYENLNLVPATTFIGENNFYNLHPDDIEFLDYSSVSRRTIYPASINFPFSGRIWFLVNSQTASAAELAVLHAMSIDFATVVGTNTSGIMPATRSYIALPNSGIIFQYDVGYFIDETGRSLEEFGITPHYPNRPGLDALNTVLQMIEEIELN